MNSVKSHFIAAEALFDGFLFGSSCLKIIEHNAGDRVRAQIADSAMETAIHTANCLYISPDRPGIKLTGTNTAINTSAIETSAPPISFMVNWVASTGDLPSSRCLFTFSITTIASSTTVATARTIANKVKRLIDMSKTGRVANVPIKDTGIAIRGTSVALGSPRNTNIIATTIIEVSIIVLTTSFIDSRINSVSS